MYMTLERLTQQDYLLKRTDKNIAFQNKGARYGLAPKTFKLLRDEHGFDEQALHPMYNNKTVSEVFIDHIIDTLKIYLYLRTVYPDSFEMFTRTELARFEDFPTPTPDMYLRSADSTKEYFVELFHDFPPKNARKRLDDLIEHYDQEGWSEYAYPTLLFVLADARTEGYFATYAKKRLDDSGMEDEITILTSTKKPLDGSERSIWTNVAEPKVLLNL